MKINDIIGPQLDRLQRNALIFGILGIVVMLIGAVLNPRQFFFSYLYAYLFWFGVTMGSFGFLMLHHVTGGGWGFVLRRFLEAGARNLPVLAVMFLPILVGVHRLYIWSNPNANNDPFISGKGGYLSVQWFAIRAACYFAVWFTFAFFIRKWTSQQDREYNERTDEKLNLISGGGLLVFVYTVSFAAFDWLMSLTPHWYSALFGAVIIGGQALSTLSLMGLLLSVLAGQTEFVKQIPEKYIRDIGNLMLAFTLFWGYTNFSQFMIQFAGNLPGDASFYFMRTIGLWLWIGAFICVFHFWFPFASLLSSTLKVNINNLARLGAFIIFIRHLDLLWYVQPTATPNTVTDPWIWILAVAAPCALGGIWLFFWAGTLKRENLPVVPIYDARIMGQWPNKEVAQHV